MKRRKARKPTKKQQGQLVKGAAIGVGGQTLLDFFFNGFMTDDTGRFIMMGAGAVTAYAARDYTAKGVGVGVTLNSAYAKFLSKTNNTIGTEVLNLVGVTDPVAGLPHYATRHHIMQRQKPGMAV